MSNNIKNAVQFYENIDRFASEDFNMLPGASFFCVEVRKFSCQGCILHKKWCTPLSGHLCGFAKVINEAPDL